LGIILKRHHLYYLLVLFLIQSCCPHKFIPSSEAPPPPPAFCVPEKIRVALVLGSGGVRGLAHVGVIEELKNAGVDFDLIIGCSAGSLVGALYADCPDICHVQHAVGCMNTDTMLDINIWEARFGLSQGTSLLRVLDENLDAETFEELQIPLIVVATDIYSGELVPIGSGDLVKAVRASCSIPLVFVPVELHGRILVDGGVINPVPVCLAKELGADIVIAVDLCELLPTTFPTNLFGIASRSTEIAFLWQNSICVRDADVIIRPKMCGIGTFDDSQREVLLEAGRQAAREAIPKIQRLLCKLPPKAPCCQGMKLVQLNCYNPVMPAIDTSLEYSIAEAE